ncbi:MAG: DUF6166 domain-containing protein [Magnetospiraceae bacterium]
MKVYEGIRGPEGVLVTVGGTPLDPRLDLRQHSMDGFEWGYEGGGPQQLALALLADALGDDSKALAEYREFVKTTIVHLEEQGWSLTDTQIRQTISSVVQVNMTLEQLFAKVRGQDQEEE